MKNTPKDLETLKAMFEGTRLYVRVVEHWSKSRRSPPYEATDLDGTSTLEDTVIVVTPPGPGNDILFLFSARGQLLDVKHCEERHQPEDIAGGDREAMEKRDYTREDILAIEFRLQSRKDA